MRLLPISIRRRRQPMPALPNELRHLRVSFRDESLDSYNVSIPRALLGGYSKTHKVKLPPGDVLEVYVEIHNSDGTPDVSLYISDRIEQVVGIRCTSGVVVSYIAQCGYECLFQVGTGPWE